MPDTKLLDKIPLDQLKVRTPCKTINLSNPSPYNVGGISFSGMVEVYGASRGGKSTFVYQCCSNLLEDYGDRAMIVIMAVEGYPNAARLKMAFGVDIENDSRIKVELTTTIEDSNTVIQRYSKEAKENHKYLIIVWDSISASSFNRAKEVLEKSLEDGEDAERGMTEPMARAQVLKWCLNNTLHAVYRAPVIVFLINQITTKVNRFQTSQDSSGGFALRHNVEERYQIDFVKHIGGDGKGDLFKTGTLSKLSVIKSRNIPGFQDIPLKIDDTLGGVIVDDHELPIVASGFNILEAKSGWYTLSEEYQTPQFAEKFKKGKTLKDLTQDPDFMAFLQNAVVKFICKNFKLVDFCYKQIGVDIQSVFLRGPQDK